MVKRTTILWLTTIQLLTQIRKALDLDVTQITKNDEIWLDIPNKFSFPYDKTVRDIERVLPNLKEGTRNYASTSIIDKSCTLAASTKAKDNNIYIANLCNSNTIIVYKFTPAKVKTLERRKTLNIQGTCYDMIYYEYTIIITCKITLNNAEYLRCYFYDQQADSIKNNQILMSGLDIVQRPSGKIGNFNSNLGRNRPYLLVYDKPVNTEIGTTQFKFRNNRAMYLVDLNTISTSNLFLRNQPNVDMISGVAIKSNQVYITGYKNTSPVSSRGKIFMCPVNSNLVVSSCTERRIGIQIAQGYFEIGVDENGVEDTLYFHNDISGKNIVGVCKANIQSQTQIDSKCQYITPISTSGVRASGFTECRKEGCELVYESVSDKKKAGIDYLKYNETSQGAGYLRRRFEADTVTSVETGQENSSPWTFSSNNRILYLIDDSSIPDLMLNTAQIALGGFEINFNTFQINKNTTLKNKLIGEVIEAKKMVEVKNFDFNLRVNQGFNYEIPYREDWLLGNNNVYTVEGTNQNSIVINSNQVLISVTNTGIKLDKMHPAGDVMVGITLNDLSRCMMRIFTCEEDLQATVKLACQMVKEVTIKGRSSSIATYQKQVAEGKISATSTPFIEEEFIHRVYNFELSLVVIMKESVSNTLSIYSFDTEDWTQTFYNTTSEVFQFNMIENSGEIFFAFINKAKNKIEIYQTKTHDLSSSTKIMDLDSMLKPGDFCPTGFSLIPGSIPKIRYLSQCSGANLPAIIGEVDIISNVNIVTLSSYYEVSRPSLANLFSSEVTMCVSGEYSYFLSISNNLVYVYSIPDTNLKYIDLKSWGMDNLLDLQCHTNSVTVQGIDSNSLITVATLRNKNLENSSKRIHSIYKFSNSLGYSFKATELGESLYFTLNKTNSARIYHRIQINGPRVFSNTKNSVAVSSVVIKASNSFNTSRRSINVNFLSNTQSLTMNQKSQTALQIREYNLEDMTTITGPVYTANVALQAFDRRKFQIFSRVNVTKNITNLSTTEKNEAHIAFSTRGFVGGLLSKFSNKYFLSMFKDPDTLRGRVEIKQPCDLIDVESDLNLKFGIAALNCIVQRTKRIYFYRRPISPEITTSGFGYYDTEQLEDNKELKIVKVDEKVFLVFELKVQDQKIVAKVLNLEKLESTGTKVAALSLFSVSKVTSYSIFSTSNFIAIAYVLNYDDDPKIRLYSKVTKLVQNELAFSITSNIKFIEDMKCYDTQSISKFDCVFVSSGNYISEYQFEYSSLTNKITQKIETIYENYKDFTAEKIEGKEKYFAVKGYSQSMKRRALLIYKRKNEGGSKFLNYAVDFSEFGARTYNDVYFDFYRYFDEYKLYAKANPSKKTAVFRVGNFSLNVIQNDLTALKRTSYSFPDSTNKPSIIIGNFFTVGNDVTQTGTTTVSNNTSAGLSTGVMVVILSIIFVLIIVGLGIFYYMRKGKLDLFSKRRPSKDGNSQKYFDNVTIFDHSSKLERNPVYEISRF